MSQCIARDFAPNAHMVKLWLHGPKTYFYVAQTLSIGQLRKDHHAELIETSKAVDFVVAPVSFDARMESSQGQMLQNLGENGLPCLHSPLLLKRKGPIVFES